MKKRTRGMSRPIQVYLDAAELARLEAWARARGWTKSEAVRAAVRALTRGREAHPLLAASGMIDGLPPDASARFDEYLDQTFVVRSERAQRARRQRSAKAVRR